MAKRISLLVTALWLLAATAGAQTSMRLPSGNFEQWSTHPAYSVNAGFMSLNLYNSFSYPTGWNFLGYPINESFSFLGNNVTVNTTLPILKVSQETSAVPDSNYAVKLQSFMLSDVVESLPYVLIASSLDSTLTSMVFPTVLSTGAINLNYFLNHADQIMSGMDSIQSLIPMFANEDVNNLVTGGIALGSFEPSRLTGSYKYHSATSGDNGGVVMLGTRYDSVSHRRMVVGGGATIDLTDVSSYTSFTVNYQSAHELIDTMPELQPDSLIVLLVSSASLNRQQGSYMCIDNLMLWHDADAVPDTCASILDLRVIEYDTNPYHPEFELAWHGSFAPDGWQVEFGPSGFALGTGTVLNFSSYVYGVAYDSVRFSILPYMVPQNDADYDFYVRSVCGGTIYGSWSMVTFHNHGYPCAKPRITQLTQHLNPDSSGHYFRWLLSWVNNSPNATAWELQLDYGGTSVLDTVVYYNNCVLPPLQPSPSYPHYEAHVRALCGSDSYSDWDSAAFILPDYPPCGDIDNIDLVVLDSIPNGYELTWESGSDPVYWEVLYGIPNVQMFDTVVYDTHFQFPELDYATAYTYHVRSYCGPYWHGHWTSGNFCTPEDPCSDVEELEVLTMETHPVTYALSWTAIASQDLWEVQYGVVGEDVFDTMVSVTYLNFPTLRSYAEYMYQVRPVCGPDTYGNWVSGFFSTDLTGILGAAPQCSVYPNPANGQCLVSLDEGVAAELRLYSLDGRLLQVQSCVGNATLRLPHSGIFMLHVITPKGVAVKKIVNNE